MINFLRRRRSNAQADIKLLAEPVTGQATALIILIQNLKGSIVQSYPFQLPALHLLCSLSTTVDDGVSQYNSKVFGFPLKKYFWRADRERPRNSWRIIPWFSSDLVCDCSSKKRKASSGNHLESTKVISYDAKETDKSTSVSQWRITTVKEMFIPRHTPFSGDTESRIDGVERRQRRRNLVSESRSSANSLNHGDATRVEKDAPTHGLTGFKETVHVPRRQTGVISGSDILFMWTVYLPLLPQWNVKSL